MSISTRFLPACFEPSMTNSIGIGIRDNLCMSTDANSCRYSLWPRVHLAMTIGLYLSFSCSCPNHLVCLHHFYRGISSDLAVTTASLWTLGVALCRFSCTVMVPYGWVWIVDSYLISSNLHPSYDMLDKGVRIPFFLPLLFSILVDPVRCGLSSLLVWRLSLS
jgi:hypothetical protein